MLNLRMHKATLSLTHTAQQCGSEGQFDFLPISVSNLALQIITSSCLVFILHAADSVQFYSSCMYTVQYIELLRLGILRL
jgi:hypothetical protein